MVHDARHRVRIITSIFFFVYAEQWVVLVDRIFNFSVSPYDDRKKEKRTYPNLRYYAII